MAEEKSSPLYDLEKIYLKDVSFESPGSPLIFLNKGIKPEIKVEMNVEHRPLERGDGYFEVVLGVEIVAEADGAAMFLVSVEQAGVFRLRNFDERQLPMMLEIVCPNVLLPFNREVVADLVGKGGFPQLLLSPVNFETLYKKKTEQLKAREAAEAEVEAEAESAEGRVTH